MNRGWSGNPSGISQAKRDFLFMIVRSHVRIWPLDVPWRNCSSANSWAIIHKVVVLARNKMDGLQELEEETKVYLQGQGVLLNASHSLSLFSPLKLRTLCVKRGQIKKSSRRTFVRTNFSNFFSKRTKTTDHETIWNVGSVLFGRCCQGRKKCRLCRNDNRRNKLSFSSKVLS